MKESPQQNSGEPARHRSVQWPLSLARFGLVAVGILLWFWTQSLIARRAFPEGRIGDAIHVATAPVNQYLVDHPPAANTLLMVSSAFIDLLAIFLLASAVFGPSIRPFLGLVMLFVLRQVCQALCALPLPEHMLWRYPGFPSLLVTYGTSNDLFFSGHTAIAVYGSLELARLGRRWLIVGVVIAVFEMAAVLVLRAHYTMDVFTGAAAALCVGWLAARLAPACDERLGRMLSRSRIL